MVFRAGYFLARACSGLITFLALCVVALGQGAETARPEPPLKRISYSLSMSRPASHLFEVGVQLEFAKDAPDTVDLQMPAWSPGRYAVFDFAKNVQEVHAAGGICHASAPCDLPARHIERIDTQTWAVTRQGSDSITVTYKVFGDDLSGTFSQLDSRHANFNGGSVFMYVVGHKQDPVSLSIDPPANWRVINARSSAAGSDRRWEFPNYDIMIDTPTEIAPDWTVDEFRVDGKTYRVVVHSFGEEGGKRAALVRDIERIVRAETGMWGPPEFDTYTFLLHFAPDAGSGDGMEHLASTQVIETGALANQSVYEGMLEGIAHEFFHVWNVKRLRPTGLGPWDFTRPVVTRGLWIAEGFTNYYGELMLRRAHIWSDDQLLATLARTIGGIENSPGSRLMSAEDSSLVAPFLDRGTSAQRTNLENTAVSYYPKGETLGLVLDLLIRGKTGGRRSLDDVMRRMYEEFYLNSPKNSYYLRGRNYTDEDFERVAGEVTGLDLRDFFARSVRDTVPPPYDESLAAVGLRLNRTAAAGTSSLGIFLDRRNPQSLRVSNIREESAAEAAGVQAGDVIVSVNNQPVTRQTVSSVIERAGRGPLSFKVQRGKQTLGFDLRPGEPRVFDYRIVEMPNASAESKALRAAWLEGSRR